MSATAVALSARAMHTSLGSRPGDSERPDAGSGRGVNASAGADEGLPRPPAWAAGNSRTFNRLLGDRRSSVDRRPPYRGRPLSAKTVNLSGHCSEPLGELPAFERFSRFGAQCQHPFMDPVLGAARQVARSIQTAPEPTRPAVSYFPSQCVRHRLGRRATEVKAPRYDGFDELCDRRGALVEQLHREYVAE